jgi:hypothetical protein
MTHLYELVQHHSNLLQLFENIEGDEIDKESIDALMLQMSGEIKDKSVSIAAIIKNAEHHSAGLKQAEVAIRERRLKAEKNIEKLKMYLLSNMKKANIFKIKSDFFDISIKNNPPKLDIYCDNLIPSKYLERKEIVEINRSKLKEDIKNGEEVQGAKLIQEQRLDIK